MSNASKACKRAVDEQPLLGGGGCVKTRYRSRDWKSEPRFLGLLTAPRGKNFEILVSARLNSTRRDLPPEFPHNLGREAATLVCLASSCAVPTSPGQQRADGGKLDDRRGRQQWRDRVRRGLADLVVATADGLGLSAAGERRFQAEGIDVAGLQRRGRSVCRAYLDWSERRHHLAGPLGAALLRLVFERGWARRDAGVRTVRFTPAGERAFAAFYEGHGADDGTAPDHASAALAFASLFR
jgi:hypothetical protein